jgi:nitrite reductase/ring-hydroxylating ferredoxin subunit
LSHPKVIKVKGFSVITLEKDDKIYAWYSGCPHKRRPLDEAEIDGDTVICPFHGAVFSLITGDMLKPPQSKTPCEGCKLIRVNLEGEPAFEIDPFPVSLPHRK